jgi:hypothetical protein
MFPVSRTAAPRRAIAGSLVPAARAHPLPATPNESPPRQVPHLPEPQLSPEQAWHAATAEQPLETPRPLPASWQPLARRLAGAPNVRYTTGPATRAALAASGARGATTGRVIHLPREPIAADTELVVHELAHARVPLPRPRFLLSGHGHVDADEQATRQATVRTMSAAPEVARLPVGGAAVLVARTSSTTPPATPEAGRPEVQHASAPAAAGVLARATQPPSLQTAATTVAEDTPAATIDYDRLLGFLDRWLARELERRGGRYQGVF